MIAIGGAIGTGLFIASGGTISQAGPAGALVAYLAIGLMVFLLMQSLGEMSTWYSTSGAFEEYATRYVSPSFGFAQGWNYWYNWAITIAAELVAAALVMNYWLPDVPSWVWSGGFLAILFLLNALSVRGFGESEFWFASIKVITVIVFLVLGLGMIVGIIGGGTPGFANWTIGQAPFVNGFLGILNIFMIAGFSFQGTEMIGIAAGETENPEVNVPRATRAVFFRILIFYVGAIFVIGMILPYTDSHLLASEVSDIAVSPFTLVFEKAGILGAASVMNAVILTSILSAGNSGMYVSTRMLYSLALKGSAPRIFAKVNARGVPMAALVLTTIIGAACFLTSLIGDGQAYIWLLNASGLAGFVTWVGIAWSHYKFRKAFIAQGHSVSELPYRAILYPVGPILALLMCIVVIFGQNYEWITGNIQPLSLLSTYIGLIFFLALWAGHKIVTKGKKVSPLEADLSRH
nr:amino acid permease [Actinomyces sp. zg-332]